MKMYHNRLDDQLNGQASQPQYVDDLVIFDFQSFDLFRRPQHKHEHPSVGQLPKIVRIFDKPIHVLVSESMQNDESVPHLVSVESVKRKRTFCQIWWNE